MDEAAPLAEAAVTAPISLWRTVTSLAPAVKLAAESSAGTLAICLSAMWQARLSQISLKQRRWMRRRTCGRGGAACVGLAGGRVLAGTGGEACCRELGRHTRHLSICHVAGEAVSDQPQAAPLDAAPHVWPRRRRLRRVGGGSRYSGSSQKCRHS